MCLLQPCVVAARLHPYTRHHIKGGLWLSLAVHSLSSEPLVLTHFLCHIPDCLWSSQPRPPLPVLSFLASPCLTLYPWCVALAFLVLPPVMLTPLPWVNAPPLTTRSRNPVDQCCSLQSPVTFAPSHQVAHPFCSSSKWAPGILSSSIQLSISLWWRECPILPCILLVPIKSLNTCWEPETCFIIYSYIKETSRTQGQMEL